MLEGLKIGLERVYSFMHKKLKYYDLLPYFKVGFLAFILGISFFGTLYYRQVSERDNYTKIVSQFTQTSAKEVAAKLDRGESFYVFIGVSSCSECQSFAKKLEVNLQDKGLDFKSVYYIGFDTLDDFSRFSDVDFERLTEGSEGVPVFRMVSNRQLNKEYIEPGDLGSYLVGK